VENQVKEILSHRDPHHPLEGNGGWHQMVLNAESVRGFPHAVFMTYDEEHHRLTFGVKN